jgi:phospholipid/cholesterol/gamma-HCH transport system substrate-binding protein
VYLNRRIKLQLALFTLISLVAAAIMIFGYIKAPTLLLGVDRYTVTVELPRAGGVYKSGNVTYRGTEVGRIEDVQIVGDGVQVKLSLKSDIKIPSDLDAQVHSQSAIGEQYVALVPRNGTSRPLKDGDVIPASRTFVPPDINGLLDAANRGLQAIPQDNLKTVIDESYTAVGGLGVDISRIVKGTTTLSIDSRANLDSIVALIDQAQPVLDSQTQTADAIKSWAAHLAVITHSLQTHDAALASFLPNGAAAADQARQLIDRLQPTVPLLLANLVSLGGVAVTYQPAIEQLLVLVPQGVASAASNSVMNRDVKTPYNGVSLDFHLNLNAPPPCMTGFLPIQQQRPPSDVDFPDRPPGDLYCRIPQDAPFTEVRGARNYPCMTRPGKRAPTVKMCESDEQYVPLNDGNNWKGDPNATLSGQDIPQLPPPSGAQPPPSAQPPAPAPAPAPIAAALYDPATGSYTGPDGHTYTQTDLAQTAPKDETWQTMLIPPTGN